jgi:hypothetical protein
VIAYTIGSDPVSGLKRREPMLSTEKSGTGGGITIAIIIDGI